MLLLLDLRLLPEDGFDVGVASFGEIDRVLRALLGDGSGDGDQNDLFGLLADSGSSASEPHSLLSCCSFCLTSAPRYLRRDVNVL